jgi:hypothetical protein
MPYSLTSVIEYHNILACSDDAGREKGDTSGLILISDQWLADRITEDIQVICIRKRLVLAMRVLRCAEAT